MKKHRYNSHLFNNNPLTAERTLNWKHNSQHIYLVIRQENEHSDKCIQTSLYTDNTIKVNFLKLRQTKQRMLTELQRLSERFNVTVYTAYLLDLYCGSNTTSWTSRHLQQRYRYRKQKYRTDIKTDTVHL